MKRDKQPKIVERIDVAARLAGISDDMARRAKRLACPAFKAGGRIDWQAMGQWCKDHAAELEIKGDQLGLKDQKLNEEVRKLRRANDVTEGKLILKTEFERELNEMAQAVQGVLLQGPQRLAPILAGLPATEIERHLIAWVDESIGKLSRGEAV